MKSFFGIPSVIVKRIILSFLTWQDALISFPFLARNRNRMLNQLGAFSSYAYDKDEIMQCANAHSIVILRGELGTTQTQILDLGIFLNHKKLSRLIINLDNEIETLEPLRSCTSLTHLELPFSKKIDTLEPLCSSLTHLDL